MLATVRLSDKPHEPVRRAPGATRVTLRLATYNIWCGRHWPLALETLRQHPADILCLQEVLPDGSRAARRESRPTLTRIAAELGGSFRYELLWKRVERPCGNLTLARGHVRPATVLRTPSSEPYGILTDIEIRGVRIRVANLHLAPLPGLPFLSFVPTELLRMREMLDFERRTHGHDGPLIACGDYNSFNPAPAYRIAARQLRDARRAFGGRHPATRPTYGLPFVIDHVFVSTHFAVEDYRVVVSGGSDHRLVFTTLSCPSP